MMKNKGTRTETKVTVHIPEKVPENVKQQKINRLYDILKPDGPDGKDKNSA